MKEIDKALGVVERIAPLPVHTPIPIPTVGEDVDKDYEYQRENFYNLVEKVQLQLTEYLNSQRKASIQEHTRLLEILSNKSQKLPKN